MRRWWGPAPLLEQSVQTNIFSLLSAVTEGTRLSSFGDLCKRIRACKANIAAWIRMAIVVPMSALVATGVFFPVRLVPDTISISQTIQFYFLSPNEPENLIVIVSARYF